jgi:hypothetical protein
MKRESWVLLEEAVDSVMLASRPQTTLGPAPLS